MPTSLATEVPFRVCRGCGQTVEPDELVSRAVWTDPGGRRRSADACLGCGGRLERRVYQLYPRVNCLSELVIGGVYYCRTTSRGTFPFAGRRFELVMGLHECDCLAVMSFDARTSWLLEHSIGYLAGRIIDDECWPDEARRLCYPLAFFGLGEIDDYETFRIS